MMKSRGETCCIRCETAEILGRQDDVATLVYVQIVATGNEPTEGTTMKFAVCVDSDNSKSGGKKFETKKEYFPNESDARRRFYEAKRSALSNTLCIALVEEGQLDAGWIDLWIP